MLLRLRVDVWTRGRPALRGQFMFHLKRTDAANLPTFYMIYFTNKAALL